MSGSKVLDGKIFVVTGNLSVPRQLFVDFIKRHGGTVRSSVSQTTSYLVLGSLSTAGSNKLRAAERLNIDSVSENDVHEMIRFVKRPPPAAAAAATTKTNPTDSLLETSDDDDDDDYFDYPEYGYSTEGFGMATTKKVGSGTRSFPPTRAVTAAGTAAATAAAADTTKSFKPKPSSSRAVAPRNFVDLSNDDDDDDEEDDDLWGIFNNSKGTAAAVGKSSSLLRSAAASTETTTTTTTTAASGSTSGSTSRSKKSSASIDLLACDDEVLDEIYRELPIEKRKKVFEQRRWNRRQRIKDLYKKKEKLELIRNGGGVVDTSLVTMEQLEESFSLRLKFGKNPIYVAKCSTGTQELEAMGHFINRKNPIILDRNGKKFTRRTLPDELKWENVVPHLLYESLDQTNAFIVESAHHEKGGLSPKYLIQGFGFGREEPDAEDTVHSVYAFEYPLLSQLLREGKATWNRNCLLFRHSERPRHQFQGAVPTMSEFEAALEAEDVPRSNPRYPRLVSMCAEDPTLRLKLADVTEELADVSQALSSLLTEREAKKTKNGGYRRTETDKDKIRHGVKSKNDEEVMRGLAAYNSPRPPSEHLTLEDFKALQAETKKWSKKRIKCEKSEAKNNLSSIKQTEASLKALRQLIWLTTEEKKNLGDTVSAERLAANEASTRSIRKRAWKGESERNITIDADVDVDVDEPTTKRRKTSS